MPLSSDDLVQAAYLAEVVYSHSVSGGQLLNGWRLLSYVDLGLAQHQWNAETDDATNSGYIFDVGRSQAFVAVRGNQIALVFRGSEFSEPADFSDAAYFQLNHYQNFAPLISAFHSYLSGKNLDVIVTGHSLGAAMAEIYVSRDGRAIDSPKLITFGSPGVNSNAVGGLSVDAVVESVVHLVHTGDPVTYARHILRGSGGILDDSKVVQIAIPELTDGPKSGSEVNPLRLLQFAEQTEEHWMSHYRISAVDLTLSSTLFNQFALNPGAFDVLRSAQATVVGDSGRDYLSGSGSGQTLIGNGGADLIVAFGGIDTVYGGAGADIIEGGSGGDTIDGGSDGDTLYGGSGNDTLIGGGGNDEIHGGADGDTVRYEFVRSNYTVSWSVDHFIIQATGVLTFEGTDTVYNDVETFEFYDRTLTRQQLYAQITPGPTPTPTPTAGSDNPTGGTVVVHTTGADILGTTQTTAVMAPGTTVAAGSPFTSTIGVGGDVDYVRITLAEGATYRFLVEGLANGGMGALSDTFFRLRDGRDLSQLNPQPLTPTNLDTHDQVVGNFAQLDFVAPYSGLYFVSVGAGGPGFATLTGGYRVTATMIATAPTAPANSNPIIGADSYQAVYGQTINGNLISNDSDPNLGTQLVADLNAGSTTALGGQVLILQNGAFQYIAPASGPGGNDTFTYTVRDGAGGSASGTVTVQLVAPTAPLPSVPTFTNGPDVRNIPVVPANAGWIFYALDGNDVLTGSPGHGYQVFGGEGDDTFFATGQGGYFHGGPGNDLFIPAASGGNEYFVGDTFYEVSGGTDTVDFSNQSQRVVFDAANGNAFVGGSIFSLSMIENVVGTAFNDEIRGVGAGNTLSIDNVYSGLAGNDLLMGYVGNDTIFGGVGDDSVYGGDGDDNLYGGDGNDDIHAGNGGSTDGRNYADGGSGDDFVYGGAQNDILTGGDGNDFVAGDDGFGQPGDDYIFASAGTDRLRGLDGTDTVDFTNAPASASGSLSVTVTGWGTSTLEEIEIVIGTPFADQLNAAVGFTEMHLGGGDDVTVAAGTPISIWGDDGDDLIFGTGAAETFYGGSGVDRLFMGSGINTAFGDAGDDIIIGGADKDVLSGGDGADFISSLDGDNEIDGGDGDDRITSGIGLDTILAGAGHDLIDAGAGNDLVQAGAGNDVLMGGLGSDTYDGGADQDVALFEFARRTITSVSATQIVHGGETETLVDIEGRAYLDADLPGTFHSGNASFRDVTGDGRIDVTMQTDDHVFYFASGSGSGATGGLGAATVGLTHGGPAGFIHDQTQFADINADGRIDSIFQGVDNRFWANFGTPTGFTGALMVAEHGGPFSPTQVQYADVNGDARADLIFHGIDNRFWVNYGTAGGFTGASLVAQHGGPFNPAQVQYADVNGDNRADLIFQGIDNRYWINFGSAGGFTGAVLASDGHNNAAYVAGQAHYADVNADGRDDLVFHATNNQIWLSLSNGTTFMAPVAAINATHDAFDVAAVQMADMNGDNRSDLMYQGAGNSFWYYQSTGSGFADGRLAIDHPGTFTPESAGYGDVNGDSLGDIIFQDANNDFWVSLQGHDWLS